MRIVWISASPHERGESAAMAGLLLSCVPGEVRRFFAYDGTVRPCIDCGRCAISTGCSIRDDGAALLDALAWADVLVLSSPVYFSDLPGPLVGMASRMQYLWMRRRAGDDPLPPRHRLGVILLSGGGSGVPTRALANARCYMHMLGVQTVAEACSLHTDTVPFAEDKAAQTAVRAAARMLRENMPSM